MGPAILIETLDEARWSPTKETPLKTEKLKTAALLLLGCKYQELIR